jgi:hypothetical protein
MECIAKYLKYFCNFNNASSIRPMEISNKNWKFCGTSNAISCLANLLFRPPHNWNCMPWNNKTGGVVCGELSDRQKRVSAAAETKTNGVAKRGERESVRDPEWRSEKQGLEEDAQRGEPG